ncbi:MAG: tail fiber domain-containing protein [Acidobacteriota bacterium]
MPLFSRLPKPRPARGSAGALAALILLPSLLLAASGLDRPTLAGDRVSWPAQPERTLVRLTSPAGQSLEAVFEPGEAPSFSLGDFEQDGRIPEGGWKYALRRVGEGDREGSETRGPGRRRTASGAFRNDGGPSNASEPSRPDTLHTVASAQLSDVGSVPFLVLEDTTVEGTGTETDWVLAVDLTTQGDGDSDFIIYSYDQSTGSAANFNYPMVLENGAPTNSLYVDSTGRLGLGTSDPQGNLHIFGEAAADVFSGVGPNLNVGPAFNFGYSGSSFGIGSGFFNVRPTADAVAPNPALYFATRNVERMMIDRDGEIAVDMDNTFGNTFDPDHPIHAQGSGAHLSDAGVWTNASSRSLKENIERLSLGAALAALAALEPVTYNYRAVPEDPQVGFIAEDVPELVATPDRKTLAPTDVVAVLTRVVQEQQRRLAVLEQRLLELSKDRE